MTFEFDVGENFNAALSRISFTSKRSLDLGCRTLESPLFIEKWDKEQ
jgi:hypothetical protein